MDDPFDIIRELLYMEAWEEHPHGFSARDFDTLRRAHRLIGEELVVEQVDDVNIMKVVPLDPSKLHAG